MKRFLPACFLTGSFVFSGQTTKVRGGIDQIRAAIDAGRLDQKKRAKESTG